MALKEAGARRVLPLKVSGPFHSPMLEGAGKKLAEVLKTVTVQAPVTPYVTNVTAEYVTEEEAIKELLAKQVASSVLWQQSVERMIADICGDRTWENANWFSSKDRLQCQGIFH